VGHLVVHWFYWVLLAVLIEEDKKVLCQMLGKLYIPDEVDDDKIRTLKLLMHTLTLVNTFHVRTVLSLIASTAPTIPRSCH
jgi:hypothetical protein